LGEEALNDPNSTMSTFVNDFIVTYGDRHRTFGHSIIHGIETPLLYGLAFIDINSYLREGRLSMRSHIGD